MFTQGPEVLLLAILNAVSEIKALWSKFNFYYIGCRTNIYIFWFSQ